MAFATNNIYAAHKAALLGIGYAVLPCCRAAVLPRWFVEDDLATGRLRDPLPAWRAPELAINAAYLPSRRQTRRLRAFIDHMATAVAGIPGVAGVEA